jgi:hypothetical protein
LGEANAAGLFDGPRHSLPRHVGAPPENREYRPIFENKKTDASRQVHARFLSADQEDSLPTRQIRQGSPQSECGDTFNSEINGLIFAALTMTASTHDCAKAFLVYIVKQQEAWIAKASLTSDYQTNTT